MIFTLVTEHCVVSLIFIYFSVIRTRFKKIQKAKLNCKKVKVLKKFKIEAKKMRRLVIIFDPPNTCCEESIKRFRRDSYLVMGKIQDNNLVPRFIMRWLGKRSKVSKEVFY